MSKSFEQAIYELRQGVGGLHAQHRQMAGELQAKHGDDARVRVELERQASEIRALASALSRLKGQASGDPDYIQNIEQIPGRRIPFDLIVNIPIGANVTTAQQAATTISQDGPFIAVARFAAFQSAYEYTVTGEAGVASFKGRSYGRFRPIHSGWDLNDGSQQYQPTVGGALPGTGVGIFASPSNHSSFRSMQFDGMIEFRNEGSGWPRQNNPVPSAFYTTEINSPFPLPALDFFERGEVLQWTVTPLHTNNPSYGNVSGFAAGNIYPFLDSQYDVQEGILDPLIQDESEDPVDRLPNGILVLGFSGFRIIQPPGQVSRT